MIFNKIASLIKHDKALHYMAGSLIYTTAYLGGFPFNPLLYVLITGICKEIYDSLQPGNRFDIYDLLWTIAGGLVVMVGRG